MNDRSIGHPSSAASDVGQWMAQQQRDCNLSTCPQAAPHGGALTPELTRSGCRMFPHTTYFGFSHWVESLMTPPYNTVGGGAERDG
jgi:hypothetical protein